MPKDKTPKSKTHSKSMVKGRTARSKPMARSKGSPSVDELIDLPDANELARGPILRVNFPKIEETEDGRDEDPIEVPQTREELKQLYKPYAKMQVFDSETGEDHFGGPIQVRDYIQIRAGEVGGQSVEDTEQWFGQIIYIGARKVSKKKLEDGQEQAGQAVEQPDVCLRVAWFYDYGMLDQRQVTPEDKRSCSNMIQHELILSDHYDNIHLSSVLGPVDIAFFNEHSTSQPPIMPGDRFYRRVISADRIISQHTAKSCCTVKCKTPYHPERDIQHFCARASCRRWYHTMCLVASKSRPEDYRLDDFELPSEEQNLIDIISVRTPGGKAPNLPKVTPRSKFGDVGASSETEPETVVASPDTPSSVSLRRLALARSLPGGVRALATSAITRGIKSGQGIVGGAYAIAHARWLARKVIIEGGILTSQEELDLDEAAAAANPNGGLKITPMQYSCPGCGFPI